MKINSIALKNYRNYDGAVVKFNTGLNVLIGKNAQGKTNLLEAVFLCSIGKSARTNKDKDLIKWGKNLGKITLMSENIGGSKKIEILICDNLNKTIKINEVGIKKIGQLMGEFNSIYFSPDELKLVKESPDERRRFMDIHLSQFNKNYFYTLNKYNKILYQRNKLLKSGSGKSIIGETVNIWNEQLAKAAAIIIVYRLEFITKLTKHAGEIIKYLTNNSEDIMLDYVGIKETDKEILRQKLISEYERTINKDMELGYTTIGPHRDDFKITVNNTDIRHFGSQGQQRTCALTLKLSEMEVFKENIGEYPVLLLDDVLSELDNERQIKLLNRVKEYQTIITTTKFSFNVPCSYYIVENGKVKPANNI